MGISYSVETDPDTTAKAMLRERQISLKHSKAVAREIKGMTVADARECLEGVAAETRSVPVKQHNDSVGHRSDIDGWDAGRYPVQAAEAFLELLANGVNNAEQQGFEAESMVIDHVAPHKVDEQRGMAPKAMGRVGESNTVIVDVELVLEAA